MRSPDWFATSTRLQRRIRMDKFCSTCKTPKPTTDFGADRHKKDGLHSACKLCRAEANSADARAEKKAIAAHKKHLAACRRTLEKSTSDLMRRNAERDLRLADKHLAKILEPFEAKRRAVADAERQAQAAITRAAEAETDRIADAEYYRQRAEEEKIAAAIKAQQDADTLVATKAAIEILDWAKPYLLMPHLD